MGLLHRSVAKKTLLLAGPIIIGLLTDNIISLIDLAYIGRLGDNAAEKATAISAVGFGGVYYYSFVLVSIGLASGAQILFGRRNGEGRYKAAGRLADHAVVLFSVIGVALSLSMYLVSPGLLRLLLSSENVISAAEDYMGIRLLGAVFLSLAVAFRSFFIGITRTRIIIVVPMVAALLNVVLNYVFIFGKLGFPAMGIGGAALASLVSEVVLAGGYFITLSSRPYKRFMLFNFRYLKLENFWAMLRLGIPLMVQGWVAVNAWMLFFAFIERMGEPSLAASMIVKQLYILLMIPAWGFGAAVNSLVSNAIGARKYGQIDLLVRNGLIVSLTTVAAAVLAAIALRGPIFYIFTPETALHQIGQGPFYMAMLAVCLFAVANILFQTIAGIGNTIVVMLIEAVVIFVYTVFAALMVLAFQASLTMVWSAEPIYMALLLLLSLFYLKWGPWHRKLVEGSLSL